VVVVLSCHWRINEMLNACGAGSMGMPRFVKHMKAPVGHKLWACPCNAVLLVGCLGVEVGMESRR